MTMACSEEFQSRYTDSLTAIAISIMDPAVILCILAFLLMASIVMSYLLHSRGVFLVSTEF